MVIDCDEQRAAELIAISASYIAQCKSFNEFGDDDESLSPKKTKKKKKKEKEEEEADLDDEILAAAIAQASEERAKGVGLAPSFGTNSILENLKTRSCELIFKDTNEKMK